MPMLHFGHQRTCAQHIYDTARLGTTNRQPGRVGLELWVEGAIRRV